MTLDRPGGWHQITMMPTPSSLPYNITKPTKMWTNCDPCFKCPACVDRKDPKDPPLADGTMHTSEKPLATGPPRCGSGKGSSVSEWTVPSGCFYCKALKLTSPISTMRWKLVVDGDQYTWSIIESKGKGKAKPRKSSSRPVVRPREWLSSSPPSSVSPPPCSHTVSQQQHNENAGVIEIGAACHEDVTVGLANKTDSPIQNRSLVKRPNNEANNDTHPQKRTRTSHTPIEEEGISDKQGQSSNPKDLDVQIRLHKALSRLEIVKGERNREKVDREMAQSDLKKERESRERVEADLKEERKSREKAEGERDRALEKYNSMVEIVRHLQQSQKEHEDTLAEQQRAEDLSKELDERMKELAEKRKSAEEEMKKLQETKNERQAAIEAAEVNKRRRLEALMAVNLPSTA